jgi:transcription elongation factor Elf1
VHTKTIKFPEETGVMETGEALQLKEVEEASNRFKACPKCSSIEGFWIGVKREHAYVQCKTCGAKFELLEVFTMGKQSKTPERFRVFRK